MNASPAPAPAGPRPLTVADLDVLSTPDVVWLDGYLGRRARNAGRGRTSVVADRMVVDAANAAGFDSVQLAAWCRSHVGSGFSLYAFELVDGSMLDAARFLPSRVGGRNA